MDLQGHVMRVVMNHKFKVDIMSPPEYYSRYCMCDDKSEEGLKIYQITVLKNDNSGGYVITLCEDCMRELAKQILDGTKEVVEYIGCSPNNTITMRFKKDEGD